MPAPANGWKLFIPGPTHVRPAVRAALAEPTISHRGPEMKQLVADVLPGIREALGTSKGFATALSCPSTSGMEAVGRAVVRPGKRVLHLTNGNFSHLWYELSVACGFDAINAELPWGEAWDEATTAAKLREVGPVDAVMVAHCETSTGALADVAGVVRATRAACKDAIVCSDVTSTAGGIPVDLDANDLDVAVGGVQKCWACPPALALVAFSARARERMEANKGTGWTNHPLAAYLFQEQTGMLNVTPSIPQLCALRRQIKDIAASGGFARRYEMHRAMQKQVLDWAAGHGLPILAREGYRSAAVTSIGTAGRFSTDDLCKAYLEAGYFVQPGYGKTAPTHWRIGHMGDHTTKCVGELLALTDTILKRIGTRTAATR